MTSKIPINRNIDEWELPREIAERVLKGINEIENGAPLRKTEFVSNKDGLIVRIVTEVDGTQKREVLNQATAARLQSGLSQVEFAALTGISLRTLQEWEQGRRKPSGAARSLLKIAAARPDIVQEILSN